MSDRLVKYYYKVENLMRVPYACTRRERDSLCKIDGLAWCGVCRFVVNPSSKLDATGIVDICPFCGSEV